jgi:hypothetical protein
MSPEMFLIGSIIASVASLTCLVLTVRELLTFLPVDIAARRYGRSTSGRIVRTCLWTVGSCLAVATIPAMAGHDGSIRNWILHVGTHAVHSLVPVACIAVVLALLAIPRMVSADRRSMTAYASSAGRGVSSRASGVNIGAHGRLGAMSGLLLGGGAYAAGRFGGDEDWRRWNSSDDGTDLHSTYASEDRPWSGHVAPGSAVDTGSGLLDRFSSWLDSGSHQAIDSGPISTGSDMFGDSSRISSSFDYSSSHSSHDGSSTYDWSNAWGTANDHQIPAESNYTYPSHDFTTTTYGDHSSWDSGSDSTSWSSWD